MFAAIREKRFQLLLGRQPTIGGGIAKSLSVPTSRWFLRAQDIETSIGKAMLQHLGLGCLAGAINPLNGDQDACPWIQRHAPSTIRVAS